MFFYIYIAFAEVSAQSNSSSSQVVYDTLDNIFTAVGVPRGKIDFCSFASLATIIHM
mgnify:CR=1 FL=1